MVVSVCQLVRIDTLRTNPNYLENTFAPYTPYFRLVTLLGISVFFKKNHVPDYLCAIFFASGLSNCLEMIIFGKVIDYFGVLFAFKTTVIHFVPNLADVIAGITGAYIITVANKVSTNSRK